MVASPLPSRAPDADPLAGEVEALRELELADLRARWREILRKPPPPHLGRALLLRLLAYKLQAKRLGDLDPDTAKYLEGIARARARRLAQGERPKPKAVPPVPPASVRSLKPGTLFVREFAGRTHAVTVVETGFAYEGRTYASLSEIARLITGTRWNGPRFFGLRDKGAAA